MARSPEARRAAAIAAQIIEGQRTERDDDAPPAAPHTRVWETTAQEAYARLADEFIRARSQGLRPPPNMTLPEWADTFRRLSKEASSTGGRFETARVEVARGPMLAVTEPGVHELTVMSCTQLMKTELINNIVGYHMHLDPCPMLVLQPKEDMAEAWSKDRLAPMIRDTPALADLFGDSKSRDSSQTILHKTFPGGHITVVGAASPSNLAMRPIRIVLADEVDKYPVSAGAEGDPLSLAEERTATFPVNYLLIRVCSPTVKGSSRIEQSYLESDQRRPFVGCPHCGHRQHLTWSHVQWGKDEEGTDDPDSAQIYCLECGCGWSEADRLRALETVEWRQTKPFRCCGADQTPHQWDHNGRALCEHCGRQAVSNRHAGFHVSKLYSPWEPMAKLARKFLAARNDPERLKTFVNTQLAETWEERGTAVDASGLMSRRELYAAEIPDGVALLTAGVDVQDDRLEIEVVGWGRDEESWSVAYEILHGDPGQPEVWHRLDELLQRRWLNAAGRPYVIEAASVDTGGHNTQSAYQFCRQRGGRRIWAVKGASEKPGARSPVWPRKPTLKNAGRVPLYIVGVNAAKDAVVKRLGISAPGPGYSHFPADRDSEYFEQLTAERLVVREHAGVRSRVWVCPKGRRNEALDCRVYAYSALQGLLAIGIQLNRWADRVVGPRFAPEPSAAVLSNQAPARSESVRGVDSVDNVHHAHPTHDEHDDHAPEPVPERPPARPPVRQQRHKRRFVMRM